MAAGNTHKPPAPRGGPITGETFAALAAASPGKPTGRVRTLDEARRALQIPASAEPDVLRLWGKPYDFQLVVYPVEEATAPDRVAEFALLRVVTRKGGELVAGTTNSKLQARQKSNALWVVYGSIATAIDGALVIESLAVGPAFDGQLSRSGDDIALGVTGAFLRLLSPPRILAACAEQLHVYGFWLDVAQAAGTGKPMSEKQRALLVRIDRGRPRHAPIPDDHLIELGKRHIVLCQRGTRRTRLQLAREFGLTPTQVRDRLHKARVHGYLTPSTRGRASAQPGPRLLALGWTPPERNPSPVVNIDNSQERPKRHRRPKHD